MPTRLHQNLEWVPEPNARITRVYLVKSELLPCHYFDFFYGTSHGDAASLRLYWADAGCESTMQRIIREFHPSND